MLHAQQYLSLRNVMLRFLEALGAAEETVEPGDPQAAGDGAGGDEPDQATPPAGAAIVMDDVAVRVGGHTILQEICLDIAPGSHVAIVGPSGAGKSSLVGLLLGWHRPAEGGVFVDGASLDGQRLEHLRRQTVWIDPAVQLWNRPLLENLVYGASTGQGGGRLFGDRGGAGVGGVRRCRGVRASLGPGPDAPARR